MSYPLEVLADSPVAYYRMSDGGATLTDSSGNARNGTISTPVTHGVTGALEGAQDDGALEFTGATGSTAATNSNAALANNAAGAVEAWLWWPDSLAGATVRDTSGVPSGDDGWLLAGRNSGITFLYEIIYRVGSSDVFTGISPTELEGGYHQVAVGDHTHTAAPDPFVQPTGAADAYSVGDRVTFEGKVYESTIDANVWSPSAYPAGWKAV